MDTADVRILCQMIAYFGFVIANDGVITAESWGKQMGPAETAAVQRLIDEVGL